MFKVEYATRNFIFVVISWSYKERRRINTLRRQDLCVYMYMDIYLYMYVYGKRVREKGSDDI